jgi:predicted aspartyl protease
MKVVIEGSKIAVLVDGGAARVLLTRETTVTTVLVPMVNPN